MSLRSQAVPTPRCAYCGGDTKFHRRTKIRNTLFVITTVVSQALLPRSVARVSTECWERFARAIIGLLMVKGVAARSFERTSVKLPRARALWDEAGKRGIRMCVYTLLGIPLDFYDAQLNTGHTISFFGLPRPPKLRHRGERWMDDKFILKKRLAASSIPVSHGSSFSNFGKMRAVFRTLPKPVVVKPRRGSLGNHTTTYVYTERDLYHAYRIAKLSCHFVIMEEHLSGPVIRATVIGGKVVGMLSGEPPRVTGDGIRTISELILEKNLARGPLVAETRASLAVLQSLERRGYTLHSIVENNKTIDLTHKIGVRNGGVSHECLPSAHPELIRIFEYAARVVDDPIIGFDFILPDIAKDPRTQKWGIIEANSLPFIHLHNEPALGTRNNIAQHIWNLWESTD